MPFDLLQCQLLVYQLLLSFYQLSLKALFDFRIVRQYRLNDLALSLVRVLVDRWCRLSPWNHVVQHHKHLPSPCLLSFKHLELSILDHRIRL